MGSDSAKVPHGCGLSSASSDDFKQYHEAANNENSPAVGMTSSSRRQESFHIGLAFPSRVSFCSHIRHIGVALMTSLMTSMLRAYYRGMIPSASAM